MLTREIRLSLLFVAAGLPVLFYYFPDYMLNQSTRFIRTITIRTITTTTTTINPGLSKYLPSEKIANMSKTPIPHFYHANPDDSWHGKVDDSSESPFKPEKGRYHMYIGLFCPFAHRANLVCHLKGLQDYIDISIVKPYPKGDENGWPGWQFPKDDQEYPDATVDKLFGSKYLHEVYFKADKEYKGRYSVPLLWDKKTNTIVNNVSKATVSCDEISG